MIGEAKWLDMGLPRSIESWWDEHHEADTRRVKSKIIDHLLHKDPSPEATAEHFIGVAMSVHPVSNYHQMWFRQLAEEAAKEIKDKRSERDRREELRHTALSKLTLAEREALGIK